MSTITLEPGQTAIVITNVDGNFNIKSHMNLGKIDPNNIEEMSKGMETTMFTRGLAHLALHETEAVIMAGIEIMQYEIKCQN